MVKSEGKQEGFSEFQPKNMLLPFNSMQNEVKKWLVKLGIN